VQKEKPLNLPPNTIQGLNLTLRGKPRTKTSELDSFYIEIAMGKQEKSKSYVG
jgi:hypothetical protein